MPSSFTIREAGPSDAEAVATVHVHGWQWGYRDLIPDEILDALTVAERAAGWRAAMTAENRAASLYLAEREGKPLGFVSCGPARESDATEATGEVYAIYLEKVAVGIGVGRVLLQRAVDDLRERGYNHAVLWVLETNTRARAFYERHGWRTDGATKTEDYQGFPLHEVRYVLTSGGSPTIAEGAGP